MLMTSADMLVSSGERNHYVLSGKKLNEVDSVEFRDEKFFEIINDKSHDLFGPAQYSA